MPVYEFNITLHFSDLNTLFSIYKITGKSLIGDSPTTIVILFINLLINLITLLKCIHTGFRIFSFNNECRSMIY